MCNICTQKPIALYFFRQAHQRYKTPAPRWYELSPSFWDSEGKDPTQWQGFEAVLSGIEHELGMGHTCFPSYLNNCLNERYSGRLLYTTGDTVNAVRYFLGLLRESSAMKLTAPSGLGLVPNNASVDASAPPIDRVYLEDFRVALRVIHRLPHNVSVLITWSPPALEDNRECRMGCGQGFPPTIDQALSSQRVPTAPPW
jgi:hypothetical protein